MMRWTAFLLALVLAAGIHESVHVIFALVHDEYASFRVRPAGFEVTYKTPVLERTGIQWAVISGVSNLVTISLGYILLGLRRQLAGMRFMFLKTLTLYLTVLLLLADPFNCSVGYFLYGGDVGGIAAGLHISSHTIQVLFFVLLLVHREIIARKLLPAYGVPATHILFRSWTRLTRHG